MKKTMVLLSTTALTSALYAHAQVGSQELNLKPAGEVKLSQKKLTFNTAKKRNKKALSSVANTEVSTTSITPQCPTLATGNLYTLSGLNVSGTACYHFEITERSKTTALLLNQETGNNIDLSIIRHNEDNTYTTLGTSSNAANADETVVVLTVPGHYYWFMEAQESTGAAFNFGAAVTTELDDYEFNDTAATATVLADKQHKISANMDSATDIDIYKFTSVRGQDVLLNFSDNNLDEWIVEYYSAGWQTFTINADNTLGNLQPNQEIYVRVRPNLALPVNPNNYYGLTFGSKVVSASNHYVSGESNVNRVPYSSFVSDLPYATTQAYRKLTWGITLQDSTGQPIEGASAVLKFDQDIREPEGVIEYTDYEMVSNSIGVVSGTINLGSCYSDLTLRHTEYSLGYKNIWDTDLVYGVWRLEVPHSVGLGVGGDNVEYVWFSHLCDQDLVSSNPS
ncbi:hypothetical protein [Pseudoalteromonas prydzensis]|uniref:hypothetical protein n=1 Tax=Pseudoalteromonas prydzensis TaxID=182141 RepID=UPI0007E4F95A|nr:hypothetical protein [Pseudoalteromonas prydzensis]MBE0377154.1 hypothetical protein [Pseudoalteromonas prydzensis ACAM 620]